MPVACRKPIFRRHLPRARLRFSPLVSHAVSLVRRLRSHFNKRCDTPYSMSLVSVFQTYMRPLSLIVERKTYQSCHRPCGYNRCSAMLCACFLSSCEAVSEHNGAADTRACAYELTTRALTASVAGGQQILISVTISRLTSSAASCPA